MHLLPRLCPAIASVCLVVSSAIPNASAEPLSTPAGSPKVDTVVPAAPVVPGAATAPQIASAVENSIVKIFTTARRPDLYKPWTKLAPSEMTGSGVVIEGKRILTNAHVVSYASQVQVQANQAGDKISATVEFIAPGMDLAVLKVDDATFFDTHSPLPRASTLPEIKDAVMVYGYPTGGDNMSITKGIVSRIDFSPYSYLVSGLRIQIDAAINPGNSGGPAVAGDKMIGIAFSTLSSAQNIGYIIPCEEIDLFLKDIASGKYHGKPAIYDDFQTLENPALRASLKLPKAAEGIIVHKPENSTGDYPLKEWDVITKIGDTAIDDQGMIKIADNIRVNFPYMVQKIVQDNKVPLTLIRAGKEMKVTLPVKSKYPLAMAPLDGTYPSFFIFGPMVFSNATMDFVAAYTRSGGGASGIMGSSLVRRLMEKPDFAGEQLVVVSSPFFPHKLVEGYSNPMAKVVKTVNGVAVKNLAHLVELLRDSKDEFLTIEFDSHTFEALVFKRAELLTATDDILTDNGIRSQGSADTLAVWNKKAE